MPQPDHITALDIEDRDNLDERRQKYLRILQERLGFVPNVIQAYSFDNAKLATFTDFFSELMGGGVRIVAIGARNDRGCRLFDQSVLLLHRRTRCGSTKPVQ